jgi:hypothetical protein
MIAGRTSCATEHSANHSMNNTDLPNRVRLSGLEAVYDRVVSAVSEPVWA